MHLKFWGHQTGGEDRRDRREMAMSFVMELIYWAYKYDSKSLRGWSGDDDRKWAYSTLRKALFCVGGVSRCTFLLNELADYRRGELHIPMGVLEMVTLNVEIEERIAPAIEQAQMPVEVKKRLNWPNGRDDANDRYADGEERQRDRGRQYGHRRWEESDHRYRVPRGGGGSSWRTAIATASANVWGANAYTTWSDNSASELR